MKLTNSFQVYCGYTRIDSASFNILTTPNHLSSMIYDLIQLLKLNSEENEYSVDAIFTSVGSKVLDVIATLSLHL